MPQPRDITTELYRTKRNNGQGGLQSASTSKGPRMRRLQIDSFSMIVGMLWGVAMLSQLFLISLFAWV